jgi:hypothetical protein
MPFDAIALPAEHLVSHKSCLKLLNSTEEANDSFSGEHSRHAPIGHHWELVDSLRWLSPLLSMSRPVGCLGFLRVWKLDN